MKVICILFKCLRLDDRSSGLFYVLSQVHITYFKWKKIGGKSSGSLINKAFERYSKSLQTPWIYDNIYKRTYRKGIA